MRYVVWVPVMIIIYKKLTNKYIKNYKFQLEYGL